MNNISKISLGFFPTPIEYAANLTELLNGPEIYIKRDDLSGLASKATFFAFPPIEEGSGKTTFSDWLEAYEIFKAA